MIEEYEEEELKIGEDEIDEENQDDDEEGS
jgi:hypothetical protein